MADSYTLISSWSDMWAAAYCDRGALSRLALM
jgi:hypothetical protein